MFEKGKFHFNIISVLKLTWQKGIAEASPRPYNALSLRIKGGATFTHGEKTFRTEKNDLIFVPRDYGYTIDARRAEQVAVIHFDILGKQPTEIETLTPISPEVFIDLFEKIYEVWHKKQIGYEYRMDSLFSRILENIEVQQFRRAHSGGRDFAGLIDHLHSGFTDPAMTVSSLAEWAGVSSTYLRRLFQQNLATSPLKYLNGLRIDYAAALLESGYYTAAEVAEMSGFSDPKYFSTVFKKYTSRTPTDKKPK